MFTLAEMPLRSEIASTRIGVPTQARGAPTEIEFEFEEEVVWCRRWFSAARSP